VTLAKFHPTASNVLASIAGDHLVKLWDIEKGSEINCYSGHADLIQDIAWDYTGQRYATSSKDKKVRLSVKPRAIGCVAVSVSVSLCCAVVTFSFLTRRRQHRHQVRIVDARSGEEAAVIDGAHEGAKSVKVCFLGAKDKMVTFGFTKQSQRQLRVWDSRNPSAALSTTQIDQAAGVIMPFYDPDADILYAAGKGDGNIRYVRLRLDR
jgi:coronin-1B/1C/6